MFGRRQYYQTGGFKWRVSLPNIKAPSFKPKAKSPDISVKNRADSAKVKDVQAKEAGFISKNKVKIFAGGLTAATLASIATARYLDLDGMEFNITKIEAVKDDKVKITYSPPELLNDDDTITITKSNSVPNVDGSKLSISAIESKTEIGIDTGVKVTTAGTGGIMTLHTTFASQVKNVIRDGIQEAVDLPGDLLPPELNPFSAIWEWLKKYSWIFCLIIILLIMAGLAFKFM